MKTEKYNIIIISILIFCFAVFSQFYDMFKNGDDLKYICKHLGGIEDNPAMVVSWLFIIIIIAYLLLYNKNIKQAYVIIAFIILIFLIFFANVDYMTRKCSTDPTLFSIPHYTFTVFTYLILIFTLLSLYNKYIVIFIFLLFLVFCSIHVTALQNKKNKKKYLKYSIALELAIIYSIIFLLLFSTVNSI